MLSITDLIRTVQLVDKGGVIFAADNEWVVEKAIYYRIRRLEKLTGIRFFDSGYHRCSEITEQGKKYIEQFSS